MGYVEPPVSAGFFPRNSLHRYFRTPYSNPALGLERYNALPAGAFGKIRHIIGKQIRLDLGQRIAVVAHSQHMQRIVVVPALLIRSQQLVGAGLATASTKLSLPSGPRKYTPISLMVTKPT